MGKCKISIFCLWRSTREVFQLHLSVTLPFQAFLLILIGFLYKTAQKPLKSCLRYRSKITARNERFLSGFSKKKLPKPLKYCWKTAQTAHILSGFGAGSRSGKPCNFSIFFYSNGCQKSIIFRRESKIF